MYVVKCIFNEKGLAFFYSLFLYNVFLLAKEMYKVLKIHCQIA